MERRRRLILGAMAALVVASLVAGRGVLEAARIQAAQAPIFEVDPFWPKPMPNHWILGSVVGVSVDASDNVYVVNLNNTFAARTEIGLGTNPPTGECCRPAPSVVAFTPAGQVKASWDFVGTGYQPQLTPSRIAVDAQGNLWVGGAGGTDSQILKFGADGRYLAGYGNVATPPAPAAPPAAAAGAAGAGAAGGAAGGRGGARGGGGGRGVVPALPGNSSATDMFGGPAKISFDVRAGEAYVADGARNRRVAVIDMNTGQIKRFWGAYGEKPADAAVDPYAMNAPAPRQFRTPVTCAEPSNDGMVYVCDRASNRIQVFRKDGSFVKEKVVAPGTLGEGSVWDIAFSRDPQQRFLYVADGANSKVRILDRQSLEELTNFGDGGRQPGQFQAVHSIATDSKGNIYTAESLEGKRVQKFTFKGIGPVTSKNQGVLWPKRPPGR